MLMAGWQILPRWNRWVSFTIYAFFETLGLDLQHKCFISWIYFYSRDWLGFFSWLNFVAISLPQKWALYQEQQVEIGLSILQVFKSMSGAKSKHKPHVRTYNSLMCNYARAGQVEQMEGSLSRMICAGFKPTVITYDILISGYGRAGLFDKMKDCFQQLLDAKIRPEVSTLNSMIAAYCDHKLYEEAEKLLKDARQFCVNPQASSYSILLRWGMLHSWPAF